MSDSNKQTDPKKDNTFYTVLLCLYVADPAASIASNGVQLVYSLMEENCIIYSLML